MYMSVSNTQYKYTKGRELYKHVIHNRGQGIDILAHFYKTN
jgi:hypothetical protein